MNQSNSSGGIGIMGVLGVVFLVLKLCHVITWSWWLVTLPWWGSFLVWLLIAIVAFFMVALHEAQRSSRR